MDKPIIAYDRFDGGRRQVHPIVGTVPPELAAKLRYYNSKIHEAAFANPSFVKRLFD